MTTIMFMCTGNQCRSPIGEFTMRRLLAERGIQGIDVTSAGILRYPAHPIDPSAAALLKADGNDPQAIDDFRSTVLTREMSAAADLILCFERGQIGELLSQYPTARARTFLFDDAVNACRSMKLNGYFDADTTTDARIQRLIDDTPLIRPFLPKARETTDPHRQPQEVFERVHGEITRGLVTIIDALAV
ncbi:protein tyrosine phosphatase [Bifidobacterium samirii]|nr:protein tyrosine phosphatase [Bifidobacterium samirii]